MARRGAFFNFQHCFTHFCLGNTRFRSPQDCYQCSGSQMEIFGSLGKPDFRLSTANFEPWLWHIIFYELYGLNTCGVQTISCQLISSSNMATSRPYWRNLQDQWPDSHECSGTGIWLCNWNYPQYEHNTITDWELGPISRNIFYKSDLILCLLVHSCRGISDLSPRNFWEIGLEFQT